MSIWHDAPLHSQETFEVLKHHAILLRTLSYEDLAAAIREKNGTAGPVAVNMSRCLGFIRDRICRPRGLPWITTLAVNKNDGHPGAAYLPKDFAISNDEMKIWWRGMVLQVFAYPWELVDAENAPR